MKKQEIQFLLLAFKEIQNYFPDAMLGGSVGIAAHGIKLDRDYKDLDVVIPHSASNSECKRRIALMHDKYRNLSPSGRFDFNYAFQINGIKCDFKFDTSAVKVDYILAGMGAPAQEIDKIIWWKRNFITNIRNSFSARRSSSYLKHLLDIYIIAEQLDKPEFVKDIPNDPRKPIAKEEGTKKETTDEFCDSLLSEEW